MGELEDRVLGQDFLRGVFTRRQYLTISVMLDLETDVWTAIEGVASTAIEHPEWDLDEVRTWAQWVEQDG